MRPSRQAGVPLGASVSLAAGRSTSMKQNFAMSAQTLIDVFRAACSAGNRVGMETGWRAQASRSGLSREELRRSEQVYRRIVARADAARRERFITARAHGVSDAEIARKRPR